MGRNNKHKRGARNKRGPVRSERRPSLTGRVQLHEHSAYVITENGDYKVIEGLEINDFSRAKLDASAAELEEERKTVTELGLI